MFKKLKDKIVEEAKNSPQRFQQITQSVSDKLQSSTIEENFFSINDDVDSRPSASTTPTTSNDGGFTSVSLYTSTPIEPPQRRTSNSSMASDVSFLPRYEPGNLYHLQSDIEASASEMEDNVSTSSTKMGHITKEQVYAELQRVRLRYHKYRGRYTDLANHYKDLERENGKMKSVLVETQDISIRRVGELREQCQLEQKAKAHLENALRVEIDEKQYIIDTLKTKIELLHSSSNTNEIVFDVETGNGSLSNGNRDAPPSPESTQLSTDLVNAKTEITTLNERLQELKASKIISHTKEANLLTRINELEADMMKHTNNSSKLAKLAELESKVAKIAEKELAISKATESEAKYAKLQELEAALNKIKDLERQLTKVTDLETKATKLVQIERKSADLQKKIEKMETDRKKQQKSEEEYNLKMARDKMTLHTELQNKDLEVNNLKSDIEALKNELETSRKETAPKNVANNTKMDNLQSQNTKLIDKVELLTAKCNNMEAELLKIEQLRQENKHLAEVAINLKKINKGFSKELSDLNKPKDNCNDTTEALEVARNDIILLSEEKTNLQQELETVIKSNANINEMFSDLNLEHNDLDGKYNKLLIDNTSVSDSLIAKNKELEKIRSDAKTSLLTLEAKITKKLQQKFDQRSERMSKEYEEKVHKLSMNDDNVKEVQVKLLAREDSIKLLEGDLSKISEDLTASKKKYDDLETNHLELIEENRNNLLENKKMVAEHNLLEKMIESDDNVIEQFKEQLESKILETIALKDRLETSMCSKSALEEEVRNFEQILQDKDDHISESNSKMNNEYKRMIESLEEAIKIKNSEVDRSDTKLKELSQQLDSIKDSTKEKCEAHIKLLQDELNATKTDNATLNSTVAANNEEISLLKGEMVTKESDLFDLNEKIKGLGIKMDCFAKESSKLKQEKHEATKQAEILLEQKIFSQKQLARVTAEIKEEFENVQAENSKYQSQLEDLNIIKSNFEELQLKNNSLLEENQQLSLKMESIAQENISINEEMFTLKSTLFDSSKQSEELVRLNADKVELLRKVGDLNKIVDNITSDEKRHKQQIVDLVMAKEEMGQVVEDRNKCLQEISDLKGNLQRLVNDRQHLEQQSSQLQDVQRQCSAVTSELCTEREKTARLNDELSLFSVRSRQLVDDRDRLVEENERMIVEVERVKLLVEEEQKQDYTARIADLTSELNAARDEIASVTSQLEASIATVNINSNSDSPSLISGGITLQEKITELSEMTDRFEATVEENRTVKEELLLLVMLKEEVDGERKRLELMVGDLDRSYSEIKHENLLLKDEIQELKISPINLNSSSMLANNFNLSNGNNNNTTATIENLDLSKEIDQLKEKVLQYKAIDATNRSSIEFYELELDRARARGEKLERKLDETLVTLHHCAELSGVETQVEYLRHVLYNYMLGREGAVLARVIAAVCKFDPAQTEAVLKHEQQKQTLLGQFGLL